MLEISELAKHVFTWMGPPLVWIFLLKIFPDFVGSNLVKALEARRSANLERLKGEIFLQNASEIEALKIELQSVSSTVKTSADFLIAGQGELRGKTIAAAELIWAEMIRLREAYGPIIFIDTILTKKEFSDLISGKLEHDGYFDLDNFRNHQDIIDKMVGGKELDQARLFVGDRLWLIFYNYRAIVGRYAYLVTSSFGKQKIQHWQKDYNIVSMLENILSKEIVNKIQEREVGGLEYALGYINAVFLKEAARVMSGSSSFAASLTDVQATMLLATESINARNVVGRR